MKSKLRFKLRLPFLFLIKTNIAKWLGFKNSIRVLNFFLHNNNWSNYLINRENSDYYKISKLIFNKIKKSNIKILEIGFGAGNILKEIKKTHQVVGIDSSEFNVLIAKYFFAKGKDILIEADIEKGVPYPKNSFDIVHLNDTFQYIKNKEKLIKEIYRVLKSGGILAIIHTHTRKLPPNILGIAPSKVKILLKSAGFKTIHSVSDQLMFLKLLFEDSLAVKSENLGQRKINETYSVIASKAKDLKNTFDFPTNAKKFVFVSPHLDDAVLSSGNLINRLIKSGNKVLIVTVFTQGTKGIYSDIAQKHLSNSGFSDAQKLFFCRKDEDKKAIKYLGASYSHLDFTDGAFRKDERGKFIYNSKTLFSGKISLSESKLVKDIGRKLNKFINNDSVVIAPLGVGGHIDHLIARETASNLKNKVLYWEDFPYNTNPKSVSSFLFKNMNFQKLTQFDSAIDGKKIEAIKKYKSQFKALFPTGNVDTNFPESYYTKISL